MRIFNEAAVRRISEADEEQLQLLHGVIFGCVASTRKLERNILEFAGYEPDDYDELVGVRERARALDERDLQFVGWLLGLRTVSTGDRLSRDICKFLSGQIDSERGSRASSETTRLSGRSVVSIQNEDEHRRLQAEEANANQIIELERQLGECRRRARRSDAASSMSDNYSLKSSEMVQNWLQNAVPESKSTFATNFSAGGEKCGGSGVATIGNVSKSVCAERARMDDVSKLLVRQVLGTDLPKFSGDAKECSTFINTYRRTTADCGFFESENMKQLRKCLNEPARNCVRMVLLILLTQYQGGECVGTTTQKNNLAKITVHL
jgi:hypothetical protein